ncbi:MAG: FecR domain-containing protein [Bdellovibrionales bacterium]|nr:FecR domain-containing protein [Oligoflexia bacterium]
MTIEGLLALISFVSLSPAQAAEAPKELKMQIHKNEKWSGSTIKTEEFGAKFEVLKTHTLIEVAPHSEVKVQLNSEPESIELITGMARAHVQKKLDAASNKVKFLLNAKVATMGVRGTDFLAIATPILGESEIIVFEGNVDFTSASDGRDMKNIPAGHWGGIGGRFGAKTHELIELPKQTLEYFNQVSSVK